MKSILLKVFNSEANQSPQGILIDEVVNFFWKKKMLKLQSLSHH